MLDEFTPSVRRRLDHTLAQWRQWRCEPALVRAPRILCRLGGGHSNHSVLVEGGGRYVVRIEGAGGTVHDSNRQAEWRALEDAAAAGLAPRPRYFNPDLGTLVCDYLPPDETQRGPLEDVAVLLRSIHALPGRHQRLDLRHRIQRYEQSLSQRGRDLPAALVELRPALHGVLKRVRADDSAAVVCHHDLLRANRLYSGGRLYALDWEYCAMGSRWYDLAVVMHGDDLSRTESEHLAAQYLARPPTAGECDLMHRYGALYRYLELLWYLALGQSVPAGVDLGQRQARLTALLEGG